MEIARMRDLKLNDEIPITLPVHVWHGIWCAYINDRDAHNPDGNILSEAIRDALVDPIFMREYQAKQQQAADEYTAAVHGMIHGQPPEGFWGNVNIEGQEPEGS